ncbi:MAG: tetratricopeptide repeat protein [Candidatus Pacebacteria bacterium]|nr:tetratricopeptide repeat protein [Candidatus Paceibacterota bacterium]
MAFSNSAATKSDTAIAAVNHDQNLVKSALQQGTGNNVNKARVHGSLGKLLLRQQRFQQAEQELTQAIMLEPNNPDWLLARSKSLVSTGKFDAALADAAEAVIHGPDNAEVNNQFGVVLLHKNRVDEAILCFAKAIECEPTNKWYYLHLAEGLRRNRLYDAAIEIVTMLAAEDPKDEKLTTNLAELYGEAKDPDQVMAVLTNAVANQTSTAKLCQRIVFILNQMGESQKSAQAMAMGLKTHPDDAILQHLNLGASGKYPDRVANEFIKDKYRTLANDFDQSVISSRIRTPGLLRAAILQMRPKLDPSRKVPHKLSAMLDLGAGTGMMGIMVQDLTAMVKGIDLSLEMLAIAQKKHVYNEFELEEISTVLASDARLYEGIISGSALRYYSKLEPLFKLLFNRTMPNGFCVFDLEASPDQSRQVVMHNQGFFQHSRAYIESALTGAGFEIVEIADEHLYDRNEQPVKGYMVSVRRPLA